MAKTEEQVILNIQTNVGQTLGQLVKLQRELNGVRQSESDLKKALKDGTKTTEEYDKEMAELTSIEIGLKDAIKTCTKEINDQTRSFKAGEGSLEQMRVKLIEARKEYESLSKADRESKFGEDKLKNIQDLTTEIKQLEYQQLDFRRNVGNYADALLNVDPAIAKMLNGFKMLSQGTMQTGVAFKNVIPAIKAFGTQLLKLAANPFVLAITAIVLALKKLVDQFKMNDDAMTALQQLFAAFQPIIDIFVKALDAVVSVLTKVIGWVTNGVTALMSLIPAFKESSEAAQNYVKAMDALEEKERQYTVQTAKNEAEISELRAKAIQKDKYTAEQRKKFLEEAGRLEKENLRMEKEVAEEKLRLAKEDAERRKDTSDDTKNKIADLEANVWRAVKSYNDGMRSIEKATQRAIAEIDKLANKDITMTQYKQQKAALEKVRDEAKKTFESTNYKETNVFGQVIFNTQLYEENKRNLDQAEADLNNFVSANEETAKRNSQEMQNIAKDMAKNLLQARNDYEQAVLDLMDESLEKQLIIIEDQHKKEINALKDKLANEANLNKEARDLINKTIELKEKKFYERLILMESNYWASVRQNAIDAINSILDTESKLVATDPNRNIQQFILNLRKQLLGVASEFENFGEGLSESFKTQFQALKTSAGDALKRGFDFEELEGYSDNVKQLLNEITNGVGKFSKENTKTIDQFYNNIAQRQRELNFTESDARQFAGSVRPYYERINELYEQYIQIPKNYAVETANIIYNELKNSAKKIQGEIFKSFSFDSLSDDFIKKINVEIKQIDSWLKTINFSKLTDGLDDDAIADLFGFQSPSSIKVDWSKVGKDAKKYAEMYGNELSNTLSGALKFLSGSDDIETQLEWLVHNYEKAIRRINQYNEDLLAAYQKSGDKNFLTAMFDTATIEPELRRLHDIALENGKDVTDYEMKKLEVQKKYVGESDRELRIQNDLLSIENERLTKKKQQETAQLNYAKSVRSEVENLEKETNREVAISRENIATRQEIIQKRKEEAEQIRENIKLIQDNNDLSDDEKKQLVSKLQEDLRNAEQTISNAQEEVRKLEEKITKLLEKLAETGFMSTEQVDETIRQLGLSIAQTDAQIQENTQQTTQNVRNMWMNTFTNITGGLGQLSGAFNSLFTEMGEMNDKYNTYAEAAAYFTILLQMAEGIATAVAKGMELGWPAAAVMIPVGIGTIVSGIASALSVYNQAHKPNYAEGGLIGGRYAKTRAEGRRDDVPINASVGEYIVNAKSAKQYRELLDLINFGGLKIKFPKTNFADGGYVSQATTTAMNDIMQNQMVMDMMTEAVSNIQPVVSVREITNVQQKVKTKEMISKK